MKKKKKSQDFSKAFKQIHYMPYMHKYSDLPGTPGKKIMSLNSTLYSKRLIVKGGPYR